MNFSSEHKKPTKKNNNNIIVKLTQNFLSNEFFEVASKLS